MTDYPAVRRVMGPDRERVSDAVLEAYLERAFPDAAPEYVEDFMSTLQAFGRQAAPIVSRVAPAMAQGAMSGATVGGPWGALIGGLGGGAASLLGGGLGGGSPAPRAPSPPPPPGPPPPSGLGGMAGMLGPIAGAVAPAIGGAASAQLLTLLSRPETMQALLSMLMGSAGRSTIPVGHHQVPAAAFANAISELAGEAAVEYGGSSGYWYDPHGAPRTDLANPRARAALLWRDMAEAAEADAGEAEAEWDEAAPWDQDSGEGDALDHFEAALAGESLHDY